MLNTNFAQMGVIIVTGTRYLSGCVGAESSMKEWVGEKVVEWNASVTTIPHFLFLPLLCICMPDKVSPVQMVPPATRAGRNG